MDKVESSLSQLASELKRAHRMNRLLTITCCVAVSIVLLGARKVPDPQPTELSLTRLAIRDHAGRERLVLGMDATGVLIVFTDEKHAEQIRIATAGTEAGIYIKKDSKTQGFMSTGKDSSSLGICGTKGDVRGGLTATSQGTAIMLYDDQGRPGVKLCAERKRSFVSLSDESSRERISLKFEEGNQCISFFDSKGTSRAFAGITNDIPMFTVSSAGDKLGAMMQMTRSEAGFSVWGADAKPRWRAP
ncbi:hypothetical protein BH11PLA1_BH11PLA1_05920 [soil metagenome]